MTPPNPSGPADSSKKPSRWAAALLLLVGVLAPAVAGAATTPPSATARTEAGFPVHAPFAPRADEPVVLAGSDVPSLLGTPPNNVVAFRFDDASDEWQPMPVQVDERKLIDFGTEPLPTSPPGSNGTVYGTGPVGLSRLQYTDANTFVGADPDPLLDGNDEIAFMPADGGVVAPVSVGDPAGTVSGSRVQVTLSDPVDGAEGSVYLFRGTPAVDQDAGRDYVDYDFELLSGPYKSTYQRVFGPNPESSVVITPEYEAHFADRWLDADWRLLEGSGVDIIDGYKFQLAWDVCSRSNLTFALAEGAFAANIDGPVRAIRSFVGGNSGVYLQRTNYFYRERQEIVTDFRVHPINGILDYVDFSKAAIGMTYRSSEVPTGVVIDGKDESTPAVLPSYESVSGPQGSLLMATDIDTSIESGQEGFAEQFRIDDFAPPMEQCWGDPDLLGATGWKTMKDLPNTDPTRGPADTLKISRVFVAGAPGLSPAVAADWGKRVNEPLVMTIGGKPTFTDVPFDHPFYADITWIAEQGIAEGYLDGTFRPSDPAARQTMAAFLYRLVGSPRGPDPRCTAAPFTDVEVSHPFCGEIDWLVDEGIASGFADGSFQPAELVTRQSLAAFLYRLAGSQRGSDPRCGAAPFTDVGVSHPFCGEIDWLVDEGIADGFDDGSFRPAAEVTRQATAAFLHRFDALS